MVNENQAAYVPPDVAPLSYHCPNTACDGHFYLKAHELGQPQTCQKCGLATTIGRQKLPRTSGFEEIKRSPIRRQNWFIRVAHYPEFRIAILASAIWLLLIQAYQPWQHYRGYRASRLLEEATFFFWRIGFNAVSNGPIAVLVGLTVISVLAYIVGWVARSFSKIGGPPGSPTLTGGQYPRQPRDGGLGAVEHRGTGVEQQSATAGLDWFLQLSRSISLNCWQEIQADDASRKNNNEVLKRACSQYKRQLQPWLSAMSDAYGPDAEVIAPARNAAARCLISLSGGFLRINNLADAESLASEALALVIDDDALEAEIQGQLDHVRTERGGSKPSFRPRQAHKSFLLRPAAIYLPLVGLAITVLVILQFADRVQPSPKPPFTQFERDHSMQNELLSTTPSPITVPLGSTVEVKPATPLAPRGVTGAKGWETAEVPNPSRPGTTLTSACEAIGQTRPANGTEAELLRSADGHGTLAVTNGNLQDAAVILADQADQGDDRLMYIRSGQQATMTGILPGQYRIKFQIGKGWDKRAEQFLCVTSTDVFDKTKSFTEEERANGIEFSRLSITLHKVVGGNARTSAIDHRAFVRRRPSQLSHPK
jgi:hypothetical protein